MVEEKANTFGLVQGIKWSDQLNFFLDSNIH